MRARFAAKVEIEPEEHTSVVVFGEQDGIPNPEFGEASSELLDSDVEATLSAEELEQLRIEAGMPAWGKEIDDSILPAEAGLDETRHLVHQGLLPGAGADRETAQSRQGQSWASRARGRGRAAGWRDARRRQGGRSRDERGRGPRARVRARRGAPWMPSSRWERIGNPVGRKPRKVFSMAFPRRVPLLAAALVLVLAVAACGGYGDDKKSEEGATTTIGGVATESHGTRTSPVGRARWRSRCPTTSSSPPCSRGRPARR